MLTYGESLPENWPIQEKDELKNERERGREGEREKEKREEGRGKREEA